MTLRLAPGGFMALHDVSSDQMSTGDVVLEINHDGVVKARLLSLDGVVVLSPSPSSPDSNWDWLVGHKLLAVVHPADWALLIDRLATGNHLGPLGVYHAHVRIRNRSREWRLFDISLFDRCEQNEGTEVVMVASDITVHQSDPAQLGVFIDHHSRLLDAMTDAYVETNLEGKVTEWNTAAHRLFGWSRAEVLGQSIERLLVQPSSISEYRAHLRQFASMSNALDVIEGVYEEETLLVDKYYRKVRVRVTYFSSGDDKDRRLGYLIHDLTDEMATKKALADAYLHDSLTGLASRSLFTYRLSYALSVYNQQPGQVAVMVVDVDRFRDVNDAFGHDVGDKVLAELARRVAERAGRDRVARFGSDQFLVLVEGSFAEERALSLAEEIQEAVAEPFILLDTELFCSVSIGIASTQSNGMEFETNIAQARKLDDLAILSTTYDQQRESMGEDLSIPNSAHLLSCADAALHQAKMRGGACTELFGEVLRLRVHERVVTESALHRALDRSELVVFYQPVIDISSTSVIAVEALLRWEHPDKGLLTPDRFIPVAEESGLIVPIGTWVIEEACRHLVSCTHDLSRNGSELEAGFNGWTVEVNLSAKQIDHPHLVSTIAHILEEVPIPPSQLALEITESALMANAETALSVLQALKELGVTLAIDDFGTGYSSLSYLKQFPLDILKIDKSFVDGLDGDTRNAAIVEAIINLAHTLGLSVIAEGVEREAQLECLTRLGCDLAQGFLFSKPVPAEELRHRSVLRRGA
ncbi:MAG: EAL domain-containing protein [Actinobacteria bacterium]|nr:EAL domain-containing protein [Actinomycetota bacterium]